MAHKGTNAAKIELSDTHMKLDLNNVPLVMLASVRRTNCIVPGLGNEQVQHLKITHSLLGVQGASVAEAILLDILSEHQY